MIAWLQVFTTRGICSGKASKRGIFEQLVSHIASYGPRARRSARTFSRPLGPLRTPTCPTCDESHAAPGPPPHSGDRSLRRCASAAAGLCWPERHACAPAAPRFVTNERQCSSFTVMEAAVFIMRLHIAHSGGKPTARVAALRADRLRQWRTLGAHNRITDKLEDGTVVLQPVIDSVASLPSCHSTSSNERSPSHLRRRRRHDQIRCGRRMPPLPCRCC